MCIRDSYHARRMTASSYLKELEGYFSRQGVQDDKRVEVLPTVLNRETKAWFEHLRADNHDCLSWDEFSTAFKDKYDSYQDKQERLNYLVTRVQKEDEPVETFIWEMMSLAKEVFETEKTKDSVRRCRDALHLSLIHISEPTRPY